MTDSQLYRRDWEWINKEMRAIEDERREARLWDLRARLSIAQAQHGHFDMYNEMRDSLFTTEEKQAMKARRIETQKSSGVSVRRKRGAPPSRDKQGNN